MEIADLATPLYCVIMRSLLPVAVLASAYLHAADPFDGINPAGSAERVVLEAVRNHLPADVSRQPDRTVRLTFLRDLGARTQEKISISGAFVSDAPRPPDLRARGINIPGGLSLSDCVLPYVFLAESKLGSLTFSGCKMPGIQLESVHVATSLSFESCDLEGQGILIIGGDAGDEMFVDTSAGSSVWIVNVSKVPKLFVGGNAAKVRIEQSTFSSLSLIPRRGHVFDSLAIRQVTVDGVLSLSGVDAKSIDLSLSTIASFDWRRANDTWPDELLIDGTQIKSLRVQYDLLNYRVAPSEELHRNALDFLTHAKYSASAFTNYEQSLTDRGRSLEANETAFTMHEKWRATQFDCSWQASPGHCLWTTTIRLPQVFFDLVQEYGFGYGRTVQTPLLWSAVIVLFGFGVFRSEDLMQPKTDKHPTPYSRWWYSFELFLPVVDLGVAKDWRPKPGWRSTYARIHQLAGWLLIPVAIAALTGGFKK